MAEKNVQSKGANRNGGTGSRSSVRDVMTQKPIAMDASETVYAAACKMRDSGVGDVLVTAGGKLKGIVTDRDIVVRAAAESRDLNNTR
jgi:CBS domain-containing protein